tara:strand:+ start:1173 stop:1319 length:147 start_codon:yes stop_codon:yes gene_type:complete
MIVFSNIVSNSTIPELGTIQCNRRENGFWEWENEEDTIATEFGNERKK